METNNILKGAFLTKDKIYCNNLDPIKQERKTPEPFKAYRSRDAPTV